MRNLGLVRERPDCPGGFATVDRLGLRRVIQVGLDGYCEEQQTRQG